ncbi:hypothetical protein D3C76_1437490 [compost metagenome]
MRAQVTGLPDIFQAVLDFKGDFVHGFLNVRLRCMLKTKRLGHLVAVIDVLLLPVGLEYAQRHIRLAGFLHELVRCPFA